MTRVAVVIVDHTIDAYFTDLVLGVRRLCPGARLAWFDTGPADTVRTREVERILSSRPLQYAKITPSFFDIFEWAVETDADMCITVESDLAFIAPGYVDAVRELVADADYLAARYIRETPQTSRWRPYRSLRGELPELLEILGVDVTDQAFSPAQVFTRRYFESVVAAPWYRQLREFVERNQEPGRSFSLQEILLPTLARALGLCARSYPAGWERYNRYRPYLAESAVHRALADGVPLVHPIRRAADDPARRLVRELSDAARAVP